MPPQDIVIIVLLLAAVGLLLTLVLRRPRVDVDPRVVQAETERLTALVREQFAANRREGAESARSLREEVAASVQALGGAVREQMTMLGAAQQEQFAQFTARLEALRTGLTQAAQAQREEQARQQQAFTDALGKRVQELGAAQRQQLEQFATALTAMTKTLEDSARGQRSELAASFKELREALTVAAAQQVKAQQEQFAQFTARLEKLSADLLAAAAEQRRAQTEGLKLALDSTLNGLGVMGKQQQAQSEQLRAQVGELTKTNEAKLTALTEAMTTKLSELVQANDRKMQELRDTVDRKLDALRQAIAEQLDKVRQENAAKLEEMRKTVDEKLHDTLEKRLGESFKQVSERLEQVHKGLGEMQSLATGVGDLKKVLTNVKARGIWGEIQLGTLLEQALAPEQYVIQARPKPRSPEVVEFAIKLPGRDESDEPVLLPIDAKFPKEDYERLVDAAERGDPAGVDEAVRQLEARIKQCARDIRDKYLAPPHTTDFAILYLPVEGLYAEVLRRPGLADALQRDCRVMVAGPTTLWAILNALQMGFRTLAIQKRSSEVWRILAAVKKKFADFGETFERAQKKIQEADRALDGARKDTQIMGKKLRQVEALPEADAAQILSLPAANGAAGNGDPADTADAADAAEDDAPEKA